jgi:peptide/nickel transport system substrate-binding protein
VAPTIGSTAATSTTSTTVIPTEPEVNERPQGGAVRVGISSEPITLNPFLEGGGAAVVQLIGRVSWAGAVALDGRSFEPVPVLLEELPTPANGGLVENEDGTISVTYRLNPEARWEDGSPVSGEDFEYTYGVVTDPTLPIRADVRAPYTAVVPGSLRFDESTVTFDLSSPSLAYLEVFSVVLPAAQIDGTDFAADWNDQMWMSAGPFRFSEWIVGESLTMERNDRYWESDPETGQRLPHLDALVFEMAGPTGTLAGFQTGRYDLIGGLSDPVAVVELAALDGVAVQTAWGPSWEHLSFQFGPGRLSRNPVSLNEHVEYRRAVAHAIDRESIAGAVYGGLVPALNSPLSIMWPAASSAAWEDYRGSSELAAAELDALRSGVEVDIPRAVLTTNNTQERSIASAEMGPMFAAAGLAVDIEPPEETGVYFLETIGPGEFDLAEWAWVPTPGPGGAVADMHRWYALTAEEGGSNFSRWPGAAQDSVEDVNRLTTLLEEVISEFELQEVRAMLAEIEALMGELVVTLPLYAELNAGAVWSHAMGGYQHSILPGGDTWNAATWYRTDE